MTEIIIYRKASVNTVMLAIGNICLYAFLILTSTIFLYRYDHLFFIIRFVFLLGGSLAGYWLCLTKNPRYQAPLLFTAAIVCLWLTAMLGQEGYQNYPIEDILYTVCYIGLGMVVLSNEYSHIISLALYGFTAISILLRLLHNTNINQILLGNSRNYVSILLLSTMMLYYISCHDKNKPILVTPVLIMLYVSMYATGRGGILVSGFLAVLLCLYKYNSIDNIRMKSVIGVLLGIVIFTMVFYIVGLDNSIISQFLYGKFSRFYSMGTMDTARSRIWSVFFHNNCENCFTFLFGSDTYLAMTEGNLHNSFLQSYAAFGLLGFILILYSIGRSLIKGIAEKDYLWLILFFGLLLRAFTDRVFFQGYCELYLYYFIFYHSFQGNKEIEDRYGE